MNEQEQLFNRLYKKYNQHFITTARRFTPYHSDCDTFDMVADSWEKIWKTIDRVDEQSPYLKTYLTRIVMNTCMVWNNRLSNRIYFKNENLDYGYLVERENIDDIFEEDFIKPLTLSNTEVEALKLFDENKEFWLMKEYNKLIDSLPELEHKIFLDKISGKYTNQEIADKNNININRVYSILRAIKANIKCLITD